MAILVVVCIPFMFNVAILSIFMAGGPGGRYGRCLLVYSVVLGESSVSLECFPTFCMFPDVV